MIVKICPQCEMPISGQLPNEHASYCIVKLLSKDCLREGLEVNATNNAELQYHIRHCKRCNETSRAPLSFTVHDLQSMVLLYYVKVLRVSVPFPVAYALGDTSWSILVSPDELPEKIVELHSQGYAVIGCLLPDGKFANAVDYVRREATNKKSVEGAVTRTVSETGLEVTSLYA